MKNPLKALFASKKKVGVQDTNLNKYLQLITKKSLERNGIVEVLVTYNDRSTKLFDLNKWLLFRKGIIENLYDKGLCLIDFVKA